MLTPSAKRSCREGDCRFAVFTETAARTYDMSPGDIGYVPVSSGHYVENIGNTTARFLQVTDSCAFTSGMTDLITNASHS